MKNLIAYINSTKNNEINNFSNIFPMIPYVQVIKSTATVGMKELISKLKENE